VLKYLSQERERAGSGLAEIIAHPRAHSSTRGSPPFEADSPPRETAPNSRGWVRIANIIEDLGHTCTRRSQEISTLD